MFYLTNGNVCVCVYQSETRISQPLFDYKYNNIVCVCVCVCVCYCRILFGSNHLYVVHHPKELKALRSSGKNPQQVTYIQAQEEIAAISGFDMTVEGKGKGKRSKWNMN